MEQEYGNDVFECIDLFTATTVFLGHSQRKRERTNLNVSTSFSLNLVRKKNEIEEK